MATKSDAANGLSFAHLAGLASLPAKADTSDDEDMNAEGEGDEDESDEDKKSKSKKVKAEDGDDGEDGEDGDDGDDGDDGRDGRDGRDGKDAKKARSAERTRWATVLGSKSFARNPAMGVSMLAKTGLKASAIVGMLRDTPAAGGGGASSSRADRNPNVGTGAAAPKAAGTSLADRMLAARGARK